ncbi:hypothetical protein [Streptomyces sp. SM11]|uniref:hypothetical protein n=1 Tax=Streptomyces sp. SM11 TaxID=565557 RepID=UPI000CD4CEE9|nr:hypothetical protein [Streptomyces sp. SM11]
MRQCTAVTGVLFFEALLALAAMEGGPEHPPDVLAQDDFLLCELGAHDEAAEHAAHLWTDDVPDDDRDLWLLWTGADAHRVYRFDTLPLCPAVLRDLVTRAVTSCAYFDHHPGPHFWAVTDPLSDLITEHIHREVRRLTAEDDFTGTDADRP